MRREQRRQRTFTRRAVILGAGQLGLLGLLGGRMYQLQVVEADRFATLAEDNRVSLVLLPPERGMITDRFGRALAVNRQTYRVFVVPEQTRSLEATLHALRAFVPIGEADIQRVLRTARRQRAFTPITVRESLTWEEIARIAVHAPDLPGVQIDMIPQRVYPYGALAAHLLGYLGAVAEEDLAMPDPLLRIPEIRIGKAGIERTRDLLLRGRAGSAQVEVNVVGRVIRELDRTEGVSGQELALTIDIGLQRYTADRMGDQTGAAVVLDVVTGDVLAMVSRPSFDPNVFSRGITAAEWAALTGDENAPLTNKAISGQYAPGSTFKMVTALAALEHGVLSPSLTFFCPGSLSLGDSRFHCWRSGGHGTMNMHDAIVQSCDVYFYEVARRVGVDRMAVTAARLGLGHKLGIELPNERPGLIPTRAWKREQFDRPWLPGETLIAGIGQGFVLATPLQLAVMTARLVNGGRAIVPRLARPEPSVPQEPPAPLAVSAEALRAIVRAMAGVTMHPRGTGRASRIEDPAMAMGGKTGTSQVRRISAAERRAGVRKNEELERAERDHALFVGFAPIEAPRYACAVVVEHGGGGATVAAPIARDLMLETQKRDPSRRPDGGVQARLLPGADGGIQPR